MLVPIYFGNIPPIDGSKGTLGTTSTPFPENASYRIVTTGMINDVVFQFLLSRPFPCHLCSRFRYVLLVARYITCI